MWPRQKEIVIIIKVHTWLYMDLMSYRVTWEIAFPRDSSRSIVGKNLRWQVFIGVAHSLTLYVVERRDR